MPFVELVSVHWSFAFSSESADQCRVSFVGAWNGFVGGGFRGRGVGIREQGPGGEMVGGSWGRSVVKRVLGSVWWKRRRWRGEVGFEMAESGISGI